MISSFLAIRIPSGITKQEANNSKHVDFDRIDRSSVVWDFTDAKAASVTLVVGDRAYTY